MPTITLHFAIVICSALTAPEAISRSLRAHQAYALNVLTYREWLQSCPPERYDLLWIYEDESSQYIRDLGQKEKIRKRLNDASGGVLLAG